MIRDFLDTAYLQNHPMRVLSDFLAKEKAHEVAKQYSEMRFAGYVLQIDYNSARIITSDPYKINVGGIPRNSFLIMVPSDESIAVSHFTLLRVKDAAPTPLSADIQQTYFELQKKSMPELDVFTEAELQWGALGTDVLGMFYPDPDEDDKIEFSGDVTNFVSAHKYRVYSPTDELLDLIVNALVPESFRFSIGKLRLTESRLPVRNSSLPDVDSYVSAEDFKATRTALFGKTRLGKSNVVKLIAQSLIDSPGDGKIGQLIFDIDGEYANDNPQDGNVSIRSANESVCHVYALAAKPNTPSEPLKLNFYTHPERSLQILSKLLAQDGSPSGYVASFASVELPPLTSLEGMDFSEKKRARRKILLYWAILHKAGFPADESALRQILPSVPQSPQLSPGYSAALRTAMHDGPPTSDITNLSELRLEFEVLAGFVDSNQPNNPLLQTGSGSLLEPDDLALLKFFSPATGSGPTWLRPYIIYHDRNASDFVKAILNQLSDGATVILDLSNANPEVMRYFSDELSTSIFNNQVTKFSSNELGDDYIQLYFEEAHNLFPSKDDDATEIYLRLAKEGAKYHIGMVYSTQSPSTIAKDLLGQTENFFVAHLSSQDEVNALGRVNFAFESIKEDIMRSRSVGYMRMLTRSHRFVVPVQARRYQAAETQGS